jgi:hypothetical protein
MPKPVIGSQHLMDADRDLNMTPQEKALYERHLMNLNGPGGVDRPDGGRSTIYNQTEEQDGRHYVLPTIYEGQSLEGDRASKRARQQGMDTFPSYPSEKEAEDRYQKIHGYMERDTADRNTRLQGEQLSGTGATYRRGGIVHEPARGGSVLNSKSYRKEVPNGRQRIRRQG